ncbi:MAG: hypothetical protein KAT49_06110 [Methanomicrobia archaeon]|nr:hypothetical protein [Methanomicrobia archaeon]
MAINLSDIIKSTRIFKNKKEGNIAEKWLGKFKGAILENKKSKEYLKELRGNLYGKI